MGTRNLTCVVHDGTYKVAKYGQWDGYPDSLGIGILRFLLDGFDKESFIHNLVKIRPVTDEEVMSLWKEAGADDSGWATMEVSNKFKETNFALSRDCGGDELLPLIQRGCIDKLKNSLEFAADGLFCEWCYVIDLDRDTFEVYKGFNQTELDSGERFAILKREDGEYSPVKHVKTYLLDNLPDEESFLKDVNPPSEDEEDTNV